MQSIDSDAMISKMKERGICEKDLEVMKFSGINIEKYFRGFEKVEDSVKDSVEVVANHPLIPNDINIYGCVMNPNSGKLELIIDREKKTTP